MMSWAEELAEKHGVTVDEARAVLDGATMVEPRSLFVDDAALCTLLLGKAGPNERRIIEALELEGMPKADALTGLRYWPAVRAWFDRRHNVGSDTPGVTDGDERW